MSVLFFWVQLKMGRGSKLGQWCKGSMWNRNKWNFFKVGTPYKMLWESEFLYFAIWKSWSAHLLLLSGNVFFFFDNYLLSMFIVFADYQAYIWSQLMLTLFCKSFSICLYEILWFLLLSWVLGKLVTSLLFMLFILWNSWATKI